MRNLPFSFTGLHRHPYFWMSCWIVWVSFEYWVFGPHSYLRNQDNGESVFALHVISVNDFLDRGVGDWMSGILSGVDATSNLFGSIFDINNALVLIFPDWLAHNLLMLLQRAIAVVFAYLYAIRFLHFNRSASLISGVFWSLWISNTSDWTTYDQLGIPGIPMYLYLLELAFEKRRWWSMAGFSFLSGVILSFCGSTALFDPYFILGAFAWMLFLRKKNFWVSVYVFIPFGLGSFFFDFETITRMLTVFEASNRNYAESRFGLDWFTSYSEQKLRRYYWEYFGIHWALSAIVLLLLGRVSRTVMRLFSFGLIVVVGGLFLMLLENFTFVSFSPININDTKWIAWIVPSFVVGGCVELIDRRRWLINNFCFKPFVCLLLIVGAIFQTLPLKRDRLERIESDTYSKMFENSALKKLAEETDRLPEPYRAAVLGVDTPSISRASGRDVFADTVAAYGIEMVDGYVSILPSRNLAFHRLMIAPLLNGFGSPSIEKRIKHMYFWKGSKSETELNIDLLYDRELLNLSGARYLISKYELVGEGLVRRRDLDNYNSYSDDDSLLKLNEKKLRIYENLFAFPRFFGVQAVNVFEDEESLSSALLEASNETLLKNSFTIGEPSDFNFSVNGNVDLDVAITRYETDRIELKVFCTSPQFLVITQSYNDGWKAYRNGKATKIYPAYLLYQMVKIEAGENVIVLEYDPKFNTKWF